MANEVVFFREEVDFIRPRNIDQACPTRMFTSTTAERLGYPFI